jgi:hypothetical protein
MKGCQGPCEQGKKLCPSPWACEIELDESPSGHTPWTEIKADLALAALIGAAVMGVILMLVGFV